MKEYKTIVDRDVKTEKKENCYNRLRYVDVARGLAMLSVIIGHMGNANLNIFIFSFHMPLFFLLAGYFQKQENQLAFLKKKVYSLLIPYIFTCICTIIATQLNNILKIILHRDSVLPAKYLLIEWCKAALLGSGSRKDTVWIQSDVVIGNIWFLLALFFGQILVSLLVEKKRWGPVAIIFIAVIGIMSAKLIWLPFSLQAGAVAAIYVAVGTIYKRRRGGTLSDLLNRKSVIIFCFCIWIFYLGVTYYFQTRLSLATAYLPFGLFDYIGSTAAVIGVLFVSYRVLTKISLVSTFLAWIGENSLIVLCFHEIELIALPFQSVIDFGLSIVGINSHKLLVILVFAAKVLWCCMAIAFVHRIRFLSRIFNFSGYKRKLEEA